MKKFCVSKDCNACGECILQTDLLVEDAAGYAVPIADGYIKAENLEKAQAVVSACPAHALSIVEQADIILDADKMGAALEEKLKAIDIPSVSSSELRFDEDDYEVSAGYADGEYDYKYSSWDKAVSAGAQRFRQVFWSRRSDYVLAYLSQYKSKVLRPYYDLVIRIKHIMHNSANRSKKFSKRPRQNFRQQAETNRFFPLILRNSVLRKIRISKPVLLARWTILEMPAMSKSFSMILNVSQTTV